RWRLRASSRAGERAYWIEGQRSLRNEYRSYSGGAQGTTTIPIVMGFYEDDPTAYGLAASFGHPAGNVTGPAAMGAEIVSKSLELVRAILPNLNRLGILVNPILGSSRISLVSLRASAEKLGITVLVWEAHTPQEIETALIAMGQANLGAILLI